MFDGQHKTLATWMMGRERIVAKVYLDLDAEQAIVLVNSVQAKIKKLPLSPFELARKLSDEWSHRLDDYVADVGEDDASEEGFINWLGSEKARGAQAWRAALVQELLDRADLRTLAYVERAGEKRQGTLMTENTFKNKLLQPLLLLKPLPEAGELGQALRARERENIVQALNLLTNDAFDPQANPNTTSDRDRERARRMSYQSALAYISKQIRLLFQHILVIGDVERSMMREPNKEQWAQIAKAINRLVEHPIWVADWNEGDNVKAVSQALRDNQDADRVFGKVGLELGYMVGASKLPPDWAG
jgi:hypothetical protein